MHTDTTQAERRETPDRTGWIAAGGILGAILASSCCIIPLILFAFGISGAWIGTLTGLAVYKPIFLTAAYGLIGYGFWMVYRKQQACCEGQVCARPLPNRLVKGSLWFSLVMVVIATFWTWIAPFVAPLLLGL
ncbi:mercuric transporter MerT family protein [Jhaorihella thermophila]|uniref:Mercuric transport protein MerT n=1 Tax=Jhaorihella thermophila TaxID=488547 RepID=A0A1H5XVT4_9RHOB|nr:mercuric transporter MerT family protein [Jhaorihella thermophila]SEG15778.1 mercuric ion transport protein [Jhaorihella thermophila]